jgi:hypothetical protein
MWEFVGYLLEKGPDLLPINIKGYDRLRTPEHITIEPITLLTFPALGVERSSSLPHIHIHPYSTLRRLDPSWVVCRSQDDPRISPLPGGGKI